MLYSNDVSDIRLGKGMCPTKEDIVDVRMIRAAVAMVALSFTLGACNGRMPVMASVPSNAQPAVEAQSISGIGQALKRTAEHRFNAKDANKDGVITPDEYPVKSPDDFIDFRNIDDSDDGKIQLKEMLPGVFTKLNAWLQIRKTARFMFNQLDRNEDNLVSQQEAKDGLSLAGVDAKWASFAKSKNGTCNKSQFDDLFAELMLNGDKPMPTPPAPAPKK